MINDSHKDDMNRIHHLISGERADSSWIERLNEFELQETIRQVDFKRRRWPDLADGPLSQQSNLFYPHILPLGNIEKAYYPKMYQAFIEYTNKFNIEIHSEALNLRSSQVCCFNVMFPLKLNLELAKKALGGILPDVQEVLNIEFEYTGNKKDGGIEEGDQEATIWMGEPLGGKRGKNRTSIDAAIWWKDRQEKILTLAEWKYTERSYGTCGGLKSRNNKNKAVCLSNLNDYSMECYLTKGKNKYRHWEHMAEIGINLGSLSEVKGCPFSGPFNQIMRQYELAAFIRSQQKSKQIPDAEKVDRVEIILITFKNNKSIFDVPSDLKPTGNNIIEAWNKCINDVPKLRYGYMEKIVEGIKQENSEYSKQLTDYLEDRYGV